jgi:hypothetical protein
MRSEEAKMRRALLAVVAIMLLTLPATAATAAGVSVSWGDACWSDAGAASNLTWACDSDTYTGIRMTCSFKLDAPRPGFAGIDAYMEGMTETSQTPDWWKLGVYSGGHAPDDCRKDLITLSADGSFSSACVSPWQGPQGGGIGLYSWDEYYYHHGSMHVNAAWAMQDTVTLEANVEYFACQFRISASKTVGGCAGCSVPAIWALHHVALYLPYEALPVYLEFPYAGGNQCLTWQSSTLPCARPVPARNTTWGQVKSLYR